MTREKKQSNESRHTGSHPQNDPIVQIESTCLGRVSPVQCYFEMTNLAFQCCHSNPVLCNCQHLLLSSRQGLVLQNENWNLFQSTLRVLEIVFIQMMNMQLICKNQPVLIPCWSLAMRYKEHIRAHFLSRSSCNQFHAKAYINFSSFEFVHKMHLSWHSGRRTVLEPKCLVQILE